MDIYGDFTSEKLCDFTHNIVIYQEKLWYYDGISWGFCLQSSWFNKCLDCQPFGLASNIGD